jgi:hypothetical protein
MCIIYFINKNGEMILGKTRDNIHHPKISLHHEIINGIEIFYLRDHVTNWIEGMNEYGLALVNASVVFTNEVDIEYEKSSGYIIYNALMQTTVKDMLSSVLSFKNNTGQLLEGHIFVADDKKCFFVERTKNGVLHCDEIKDELMVRTNYYVVNSSSNKLIGSDQVKCAKIRKKIAKTQLSKSPELILESLNATSNDSCDIYRSKIKGSAKTTSQYMMNLRKREFTIFVDRNNCDFDGCHVNLPDGYVPKINIVMKYVVRNNF